MMLFDVDEAAARPIESAIDCMILLFKKIVSFELRLRHVDVDGMS